MGENKFLEDKWRPPNMLLTISCSVLGWEGGVGSLDMGHTVQFFRGWSSSDMVHTVQFFRGWNSSDMVNTISFSGSGEVQSEHSSVFQRG